MIDASEIALPRAMAGPLSQRCYFCDASTWLRCDDVFVREGSGGARVDVGAESAAARAAQRRDQAVL